LVENGTYYENLVVPKAVKIIGEDKNKTIIDGNELGTCIEITSDNVTIEGFTIRDSALLYPICGVRINSANYCNITGNIFTNNNIPIRLESSTQNYISKNNIFLNAYGIEVVSSSNNIITENNISQNTNSGLHISSSNTNIISNNTITKSTDNAIYVSVSYNTIISGNILTNSPIGITLAFSKDNVIDSNTITNMINQAIFIYSWSDTYNSHNNTILDNLVTNSGTGISLVNTNSSVVSLNTLSNNNGGLFLSASCNNNTIIANIITKNIDRGILLSESTDNLIKNNNVSGNNYGIMLQDAYANNIYHNNFLSNIDQVDITLDDSNSWDDGYPSGGNYWTDYSGVDSDSDGIGDTPYFIDENNQDNYPLMQPFTQETQKKSYLVVRGSNDYIYLRTLNSTDSSWGNWIALPGSTYDTPAAALFNNQVHIVVRGMDEHTLWHGYYNVLTEEFVGWTMLAGSSPSPPVLTSNGTMLCLVVHGMDDLIYYRCYSDGSWGDWQLLPNGATIDSPAAALLGNELHVVVRGTDGFTMWHKIILPEGAVLQEWSWIPGASASPPILSASQNANELYMLVRGADDGIYYTQFEESSWGGWTNLQGLTTRSPCATINGEELHVVVCGSDEVTLWHGKVDLNSKIFLGWIWISGSTPSAPTLTS